MVRLSLSIHHVTALPVIYTLSVRIFFIGTKTMLIFDISGVIGKLYLQPDQKKLLFQAGGAILDSLNVVVNISQDKKAKTHNKYIQERHQFLSQAKQQQN